MKLTLVVGARPNFMKISPIIDSINEFNRLGNNIEYRLVHTGQHYDKTMSDNFFKQLNIPEPHINLNCTGLTQTELTANIMVGFEQELNSNKPDIVIVVGDVTSTMACTIVAKKLNLKVAHIEGGIRSFDREMPEEINRLITDSITDYYFTTSEFANKNLINENVSENNIFFVGNTMIDCLNKNISKAKLPMDIDSSLIQSKKYFLMTLHRPNNVDDLEKLNKLITKIDDSVEDFKVIFPVHHRTKKNIEKLNYNFKNIVIVNPQNYLEFIFLIKNSIGVITDSGGITEETTFLNIPCLTLRDTTERPETVEIGTNELIGDDVDKLKKYINLIINDAWKVGKIPKLWDGKSSIRIIDNLLKIYNLN
jgi:UDP-N-acetylglucosamine 2-epimerase (non-hydrolysing)